MLRRLPFSVRSPSAEWARSCAELRARPEDWSTRAASSVALATLPEARSALRAISAVAAVCSSIAAQIDAACAKGLADFKRPRDIRIVDALPRSTLEKIAKAELRKMVEEA